MTLGKLSSTLGFSRDFQIDLARCFPKVTPESDARPHRRNGFARMLLGGSALAGGLLALASSPALAACSASAPTTGQSVTCDATAPNPDVTGSRATAGSSNVTITIDPGATVAVPRTTSPVVTSVETNSAIINGGAITLTGGGGTGGNRGAGMLAVGAGNALTNNGSIATTGAYNDAMAADGSGNVLVNNGTITTTGPNAYGMSAAWGQTNVGQSNNTLINNGTVTTSGSNARAMSILGSNGVLINTGTLTTTGANTSTVYMQGNNARLTNSGIIRATGSTTEAVFSNTAGTNFTARIENLAGGQIISEQGDALRTLNGPTTIVNAGLVQSGTGVALNGGNGNITFILQTGSQIVGAANGGTGSNEVRLEGTGRVDNAFTRFQTLTMTGADWTWAGTGDFQNTFVQSGILRLEADLTGNVSVAAGTTLMAGNGFNPSITPNVAGPPITVTNAGTIDLTNGGSAGANSLTVVGNYVGNGGRLLLNTYLGSDGSASDRLVISGGTATGTTGIVVTNIGGPGALTVADGIRVVEATSGGTTAAGSFALAAPAAAGAYEYLLFRGGVTGGTENDWYLRSELVDPAPGPGPLAPPVPLYRPEVPVHMALPPMALQIGLAALGTFHERQGEQSLLTGNNRTGAMWGRVYGQYASRKWAGTVDASFSGTIMGLQAGFDIVSIDRDNGHRDRVGVLAGYTRADGQVRGFSVGVADVLVGRTGLEGYSLGGYWTHLGPGNWYVDAVAMATLLRGRPVSDRGYGADVSGRLFTVSLEGGYPIPLGFGLTLEPQAQIIWQHLGFDRTRDAFSTIALGEGGNVTGRIGARLLNEFQAHGVQWQPYLKANLWHDFNRTQTVAFDADLITAGLGGTALELGGGLVARVNPATSFYATADYTTGLGSRRTAIKGRFGLRVTW